MRYLGFACISVLFAVACSSSTDEVKGGAATIEPAVASLPPLESASTTVEATFTPIAPRRSSSEGPNPSASPDDLDRYLAEGLGELESSAGVPYVSRSIDGTKVPPAGPRAKRLLRFVHLADLQLADDESPTRYGNLDSAGATSGALRPQDAYLCRMANAAVRTINAFHRQDPISFTIMGGDNADSAQTNEVDWVLGILSGSSKVECDSGEDDDLVAGPGNDGKDPFVAEGLAMPWKWVTGNHDVLVQGNLALNDFNIPAVVGDTAQTGTRDYRQRGAITTETIVADQRRALLTATDLMSKVASDSDGHGVSKDAQTSGRATYTFDAEGTPFRFLVLDTSHHSGGSDGVIQQSQIDTVIKPLLDKAVADKKWVILASHHSVESLTLDGGSLGRKEPDALTQDAWRTFIGGYPNVLFSMVAHTHANRARVQAPKEGHAWWEVMTAAIADYPHQFRVVEIFDQDNGWLMMRATAADFSVEGDPVAAEGRRRGVVDMVTGWQPPDAEGEKTESRNVELWIKKPN